MKFQVAVLLLFAALLQTAHAQSKACVLAYKDSACTTELDTRGLTTISGVGACTSILFGTFYQKVTCGGPGPKIELGFFSDSICTVPAAIPGGYSADTTIANGCTTISHKNAGLTLALSRLGLPSDAVSFKASCHSDNSPCKNFPTPTAPTPGGGSDPTPSGTHSHGGKTHSHDEMDHSKRKGSAVVGVLFWLIVIGTTVACSCYWCTCCPWYQHRMQDSMGQPGMAGAGQVQDWPDQSWHGGPEAEFNELTFGAVEQAVAPVIVQGMPAPAYDAPYDVPPPPPPAAYGQPAYPPPPSGATLAQMPGPSQDFSVAKLL